NWGIEGYRGRLTATGVGGAATGKGAHIAIVDDPIKNRQDAQSETKRKTMLDWYRSTLRTRLAPGGGVIIVQTRWHDEDLAGYLLKEMEKETGEVFDLINFPALAEENDILGREIGEVLWPERYSREELERIKKAVGSIEWNALYQQRPSAENGEIFKRQHFKYFNMISNEYLEYEDELGTHKVNIRDLLIFQTIDTALKVNKANDSTAIGTWGVSKNGYLFLLDLFLKKVEVPDQWPLIKEMKRKWNPLFQAIEDKQSGTGLLQQAKREMMSIRALKAEGDKVTRAVPFSILVENGRVYFNASMPQLYEYEEQLIKFPNAAHDDAVDVSSYAGQIVQQGRFGAGGGNRVSMKAKVISF
ncbi:MAG: phage terminase large subunit, partial [Cetobacterium sp.]